MDAAIRKIEKQNRAEGRALKELEHMDKKRDKVCEAGKMAMKHKRTKTAHKMGKKK